MGTLVGMAFIVARAHGRYEIRESVQTARGPRARSLANFAVLTAEVLSSAADRATRPFDAEAVVRAARRRHVPTRGLRRGPAPQGGDAVPGEQADRFVRASRRLAQELERPGRSSGAARSRDPGEALIELIGFAEAVAPHLGAERGRAGPLEYPVMSKLVPARARR